MRVLGLIPARGGSKGMPRKNIRPLCGRPLLAYTADAAHGARLLSRTILSTDDPEIAEEGRRCGLDVPFLRPAELAQDTTPTLPVVIHALRWLEQHGEHVDAVCLLQPTHPLRGSDTIDACIALLATSGADAVVTLLPVPSQYNPHWVYWRDEDGRLRLSTGAAQPIPRRQDLPPAFHREGSVYVTRRDVVIEDHSLYGQNVVGQLVDPEWSVNIDGPADWQRAERLLRQRAQQRTTEVNGGR